MNLKLIGLFAGLYTVANTLTYLSARQKAYSSTTIPPPPKTATIAVCIWNEPKVLVTQCFDSILSQSALLRYPHMFEILAIDGPGIEHAYPYADRVLHAPRGKLNARHLAFLEAKGEVVVFVDADTKLPPNALHLILEPFRDERVVAATSTTDQGLFEPFVHIPVLFFYAGKITGRFCAVRKDAYFRVGGFNLSIPQEDPRQLYHEEEFAFMRRLEHIGKVVLVDVPVMHLGKGVQDRGLHYTYPTTVKIPRVTSY